MRHIKNLSLFGILFLALLFTLTLISQPVFASDVITDKKMKLTIGYCPYGMLETPVMKVKKFYKKYAPNLEVEWFFGLYSVELINNWVAGKLEFAYLGNMPAVMLQGRRDTDTVWVGNACSNGGEVGVMHAPKDSSINNIKDLDGKKVATGIGSSHHRILEVIQEQEGIKFRMANQSPEVAVGNLEAGKLDGFCYWPPYVDLVTYREIGKPIQDCTKYEPEVNSIWPIVVRASFVKKHPDIVEAFVKADQDLHDFMKNNPDEAANIVYSELEEKLPLQVVKDSLARYDYSDQITEKEIETMQRDVDWMAKNGYIPKRFDAAKWADPSFAK